MKKITYYSLFLQPSAIATIRVALLSKALAEAATGEPP